MRGYLFALAMLAASACGKNEQPPKPLEGPSSQENGPKKTGGATTGANAGAANEAKMLFANLCSTCHGPEGKGDGPAAAGIEPKPRNYTDAAWQASVTDDEIKKIIVGGGQAVGKSPMMPPNQNLAGRDDVLNELVVLIRSFGKK
ncbi:MAG TPA: cytochrome c [Kofleriaceae bacterium]|nr:cytochrome c [Kofleriaceae bacterium]